MLPALIPVLLLLAAAETPPEWENPAVFAVGTEEPRASFVPHADRDTALTFDRTRSPFSAC